MTKIEYTVNENVRPGDVLAVFTNAECKFTGLGGGFRSEPMNEAAPGAPGGAVNRSRPNVRTRVYCAGPISRGPLQQNIDQAREAGRILLERGYAPLVPQLTCFFSSNTPSACGGGIPHDTWLEADLAWVATAHAVLRLPGESVGADREVAFAKAHNIPVYTSLASLLSELPPDRAGRMKQYMRQMIDKMTQAHKEQVAKESASWPRLIAFAGFAGVGKDEAAKLLIAGGYHRHNFGDIIKRQLDALIQETFGFSAFTENRQEKEQIRRTLESWGEDNYDAILGEYLRTLKTPSVNTRLVRVKEAKAWRERGGVIIQIVRPGHEPATQWERKRMDELLKAGGISGVVVNDGTVADLHAKLRQLLPMIARIEAA